MVRSVLLAIALVLAAVPAAAPRSEALSLWPQWVLLAVIYWSLMVDARPRGFAVAAGVGLLLDALRATTLGQHAVCLAIAAYLAGERHTAAQHYPFVQRWLLVAAIVVATEGLRFTLTWAFTGTSPTVLGLLSVLITVLAYPLVEAAGRTLRRVVGYERGGIGG